MGESSNLRILIGSAGRRVYLVEWFERALREQGIRGEVHVTEADESAAAYAVARQHHLVPKYADPAYATTMLRLVETLRPALFFSVNDFELATLASTGLAGRLRETGTLVLSLEPALHDAVNDKFAMFNALRSRGIPTVETAILSDRERVAAIARTAHHLIIKDRYGSGSSGLLHIPATELQQAAQWLTRGAQNGDSLVVQPALTGAEYGIDVVEPLVEAAHSTAVLARRKIRMRSGETDQAVSLAPERFESIARTISDWTKHRGSIDVDLMEDSSGVLRVIDINPRFGGGYPFSHLAGADLPSSFIAQLAGIRGDEIEPLLRSAPGIQSSKHEAIVTSGVVRRER